MSTKELENVMSESRASARTARRRARREAWTDSPEKPKILFLGTLIVASGLILGGLSALFVFNPNVQLGVKLGGASALFGLWLVVAVGVSAYTYDEFIRGRND